MTARRPLELSREILTEDNLPLSFPLPNQPSVEILSRQAPARKRPDDLDADLEGGGHARIISDLNGTFRHGSPSG